MKSSNLGVCEFKSNKKRFRNLICRANFRDSDETFISEILMHFRNRVHGC